MTVECLQNVDKNHSYQNHNLLRKAVLLEKLQVQRSHGILRKHSREKIETHRTDALKKHAKRNYWKPAIVK